MKTNFMLLALAELLLALYGLLTRNWLLVIIAGGFAVWFLGKSSN